MVHRAWRFPTVCLLLAGLAGPALAAEGCPETPIQPVVLDRAHQVINGGHELLIVALGSSSTEGVQSSTLANSYPAQLQVDLEKLLPKTHVAVVNRGIGGQDALEEVARMESDAIAVRPSVVIWQVGANGAMQHSDPTVFRTLVSSGLRRLKAAGIDVILMDNQRAPMILASPSHTEMEAAMAELAVRFQVNLFSRGKLMDEWKQSGAGYDQFLSADFVHHNDRGYRCVAASLAQSIAAGLSGADGGHSRVAVAVAPRG